MTLRDPGSDLVEFLDPAERQKLQSSNPPATHAEVDEVSARAIDDLGVPLASEYLRLVRWINGGGYDVCFYATHTREVKMLGRTLLALGIVEQNRKLRKHEMTDEHEVAYAQGESCIFLPGDAPGSWIGRDMVRRQVLWNFSSFQDLVRKVYG